MIYKKGDSVLIKDIGTHIPNINGECKHLIEQYKNTVQVVECDIPHFENCYYLVNTPLMWHESWLSAATKDNILDRVEKRKNNINLVKRSKSKIKIITKI